MNEATPWPWTIPFFVAHKDRDYYKHTSHKDMRSSWTAVVQIFFEAGDLRDAVQDFLRQAPLGSHWKVVFVGRNQSACLTNITSSKRIAHRLRTSLRHIASEDPRFVHWIVGSTDRISFIAD